MNWKRLLSVWIISLCSIAGASSQSASSAEGLGYYANTPKQITQLDWNLLQLNLIWHDFYKDGDYLRTNPVQFDRNSMTFVAVLRVANERYYNDPKPFFSLPKLAQRAVLQEASDYLVDLLGKSFPGVESVSNSLRVTFTYFASAAAHTTVAVFENGHLEMK